MNILKNEILENINSVTGSVSGCHKGVESVGHQGKSKDRRVGAAELGPVVMVSWVPTWLVGELKKRIL